MTDIHLFRDIVNNVSKYPDCDLEDNDRDLALSEVWVSEYSTFNSILENWLRNNLDKPQSKDVNSILYKIAHLNLGSIDVLSKSNKLMLLDLYKQVDSKEMPFVTTILQLAIQLIEEQKISPRNFVWALSKFYVGYIYDTENKNVYNCSNSNDNRGECRDLNSLPDLWRKYSEFTYEYWKHYRHTLPLQDSLNIIYLIAKTNINIYTLDSKELSRVIDYVEAFINYYHANFDAMGYFQPVIDLLLDFYHVIPFGGIDYTDKKILQLFEKLFKILGRSAREGIALKPLFFRTFYKFSYAYIKNCGMKEMCEKYSREINKQAKSLKFQSETDEIEYLIAKYLYYSCIRSNQSSARKCRQEILGLIKKISEIKDLSYKKYYEKKILELIGDICLGELENIELFKFLIDQATGYEASQQQLSDLENSDSLAHILFLIGGNHFNCQVENTGLAIIIDSNQEINYKKLSSFTINEMLIPKIYNENSRFNLIDLNLFCNRNPENFEHVATNVYNYTFKDIEKYIDKSSIILITPLNVYPIIPFHAAKNPISNKFLAQDHSIIYTDYPSKFYDYTHKKLSDISYFSGVYSGIEKLKGVTKELEYIEQEHQEVQIIDEISKLSELSTDSLVISGHGTVDIEEEADGYYRFKYNSEGGKFDILKISRNSGLSESSQSFILLNTCLSGMPGVKSLFDNSKPSIFMSPPGQIMAKRGFQCSIYSFWNLHDAIGYLFIKFLLNNLGNMPLHNIFSTFTSNLLNKKYDFFEKESDALAQMIDNYPKSVLTLAIYIS